MPEAALWLTLKKLKLSSNLNRFVNYRKDLAAVGTMCSHVQTRPRAEWRHSQRQSGEPRGAPGVSNPSAKTMQLNRPPASSSSGRLLNPGRGAEGTTGQGSPSPAHSDVGTGAPAGRAPWRLPFLNVGLGALQTLTLSLPRHKLTRERTEQKRQWLHTAKNADLPKRLGKVSMKTGDYNPQQQSLGWWAGGGGDSDSQSPTP